MVDTVPNDIEVTVIGGYLGSGKTTLINHILRTADERVAVLVNDFGEINIDADLIESRDEDTISLANGCICCSLIDGFAGALNTIADLDPRPERLVIEASGVADPAMVAAYGHGPGYTLDAVVVLADAETVERKSVDRYVGDTVCRQLASADIAVLNKLDLVDDDEAAATEAWLRGRCPDATIVRAEHAVVAPLVLFGHVGRPRIGSAKVDHTRTQAETQTHTHEGGHGDAVFDTWVWASEEPLERPAVERLMDELPDDVVRAKGVLRLAGDDDRAAIVQRVGRRWSITPGPPLVSVERLALVVIGLKGAIDDRWLAARLA